MVEVAGDTKWCYYAKHHPPKSEFSSRSDRCRGCDAARKRRDRSKARRKGALQKQYKKFLRWIWRKCSDCGDTKSLYWFPPNKGDKQGRAWYCGDCNYAKVRKWEEDLRENDPEAWRARNRRRHLRNTYKISVERYDSMLTAQGGVCACCRAEPEQGRSLDIDHDHGHCNECDGSRSCGLGVRAIVCHDCNRRIFFYEDGREHLLEPGEAHQCRAYLDRYGLKDELAQAA